MLLLLYVIAYHVSLDDHLEVFCLSPFGLKTSVEKSKVRPQLLNTWTCSLYPGLPVIQIPANFFKLWAVWQNEKGSIPAKSRISPQGATVKSCYNNINTNERPPFEVLTPWNNHFLKRVWRRHKLGHLYSQSHWMVLSNIASNSW